jgi:hypothetical protein
VSWWVMVPSGSDTQTQRDLIDDYARARRAWAGNEGVRESARLFGMGERDYCDRYVADVAARFPRTYTGSSSVPLVYDPDAAYAAAGRDDTPTGGLSVDETIAEIRRRIAAKRAELAPGDADRIPKGERGRRDPLAAVEYERRKATVFGLDLALRIIDETAR